MMSQEAYVAAGGNCCPACGSVDIVGHCVEVATASAKQEVMCSECPAVWVDNYSLTGFDILEQA